MKIDVENKDNGAILHLEGKIIGDGVALFKQVIEEQISSNINWLILDLSAVPLMDSSALGTIIMAFLRLKERKGKIVLLYAQKSILEILNITKLDSLFEIYDNMQTAIDAVKIDQ
ncbi:MAG: anti-sigma factor antagonist [Candidatus Poribacteria bacterium]|nr:anti-sigma factor antagonist [Candidatus Poribacteria bacterium]